MFRAMQSRAMCVERSMILELHKSMITWAAMCKTTFAEMVKQSLASRNLMNSRSSNMSYAFRLEVSRAVLLSLFGNRNNERVCRGSSL